MDDSLHVRKEIGSRIAYARLAAGYENAAEFARQIGVQPNTVYRWERGDAVPDIFTLESLARVARVSTEWILRGGESRSRHPVLATWLETPRGKTVSPQAVSFLEELPLKGHTPSLAFYDLAVVCYEQGLTPTDAALAARFTEAKKNR